MPMPRRWQAPTESYQVGPVALLDKRDAIIKLTSRVSLASLPYRTSPVSSPVRMCMSGPDAVVWVIW
jgi:hypothetical protein